MDYYVSSQGNDLTGNGSLASPYQTIQKAASLAKPGDAIKIRAGIYRETVTPTMSGTQTSPIVYEAYNNETVTISGAELLTNWEPLGDDLYRTTLAWEPLAVGKNQLFAAGSMLTESRFPFVSNEPLQDRSTMLIATAGSGTQNGTQGNGTIRHPSIASFANGYWIGGRVNFNSNGEVFESGTITQHTADEIQFTFTWSKADYAPTIGSAFYLWNKMPTSFQVGEFFINGNQVYVRLAADQSPATTEIEVKQRTLAFNLIGKSWITIRGVKIFAATIETGSVTQPTTAGMGILLDTLDVQYPSHLRALTENHYVDATLDTGICLRGKNNEIRNSLIQFSAGNGITLAGDNNKIFNCVVLDCNYLGCDAAPITTDRVFSNNMGHIISQNTVRGSGRSAITHRKLNAGQVKYNDISHYGRLCYDLGGTYCWGTNGQNTEIAYNRIDVPLAEKLAVAFYLDNNSPGHIVHHNLIIGSVQINGPSVGMQFYNNTVDDVLQFGATPSGSVNVRNNILLGGIIGTPGGATVSNNCLRFGEPGIESRESQDYRLRIDSPSINAGVVIAPYTNGFIDANPDLGCFERGGPTWVWGAIVRDSDLPGLKGTVKRQKRGIIEVSIPLTKGRKLPEGSQVKVGNGEPSSNFSYQGNTVIFLTSSSSTSIEPVYLRVGVNGAWQEIASGDSSPLAVSSSSVSSQRTVTLTGVTSQIVLIVFDASAALSSGKMQADGQDLQVTDLSGNPIPFWLDGLPGVRTLVFVSLPSIPDAGTTQVNIIYGGDAKSQNASSMSAVFPALASCNNKLWIAANDGVELLPNSQIVKKVRDRSRNNASPTDLHTEYKKVVTGIPNPNLGADAQGLPAFVFNGTQGLDIGKNFAIAQNQQRTFFVVQRSFKEEFDNCVYGIGYSGNIDLGEYVGGVVEARLRLAEYIGGSLRTVFTPNGTVPLNRTNLIAVISQAAATEVRVQKNSVLSGAPPYQHYEINGEFYIGRKRRDEAKRWYKGLLYELIAFNVALSSTQISSVEEYLSLKYLSPTSISLGVEQPSSYQ